MSRIHKAMHKTTARWRECYCYCRLRFCAYFILLLFILSTSTKVRDILISFSQK